MVAYACNCSTLGGRDRPEVGSLKPAWPTWRNPISTKNTKLSRHGGTWIEFQLFGRLRWEDCLNLGVWSYSELWLCHCNSAWVTEWDPVFKRNSKNIHNPEKEALRLVLESTFCILSCFFYSLGPDWFWVQLNILAWGLVESWRDLMKQFRSEALCLCVCACVYVCVCVCARAYL